jgi:hypothetical protein
MSQHHGRARAGKTSAVVPLAIVLVAGAAVAPAACAFQSHGLDEGTTSGGGAPSGPGSGGAAATTGSVGGASVGSTASSVAASSAAASVAASSAVASSSSSTTASSSSGGPTSEGVSCNAIYTAHPSAQTGLHWIDPKNTGTPYQVYCQMITGGSDTGGWTLTLKIDGTLGTFAYGAAPWTDTTSFGTPDLDKTEAKLPSFYEVAMVNVRVGMLASDNVTRWLTLPDSLGGGGNTLKEVVAAGPKTTAGNAAWEGLVPGVATEPNHCDEGFNLVGFNFHLRLGFTEDNSTNCGSPNVYVGFGPDWQAAAGGNLDGPTSGNFRDTFGGFAHAVIPTWGYVLVR